MWFCILSFILIVSSYIPLIQNPHWFFRFFEFGKLQLLFLLTLTLIGGLLFIEKYTSTTLLFICFTSLTIIYHIKDLYPYSTFHSTPKNSRTKSSSNTISIISANIYQDNNDYFRFIEMIEKHNPDLFLTMESNKDWENALSHFDKTYPFHIKVALENTYGIHLYSKFEILSLKVHYFVADDIPSIEAQLKSKDGFVFNFYGVHPPPPSPTEEDTAKERDGELLSVAKVVKTKKEPCVVVGDFNNVAWAKSSLLFRKTSELIDARVGRGLFSTFHAKYWFFRFPIDLFFHSTDVFVVELKTLEYFGSDHFPIFSSFYINKKNHDQEEMVEKLENGEHKEINEIIQNGKNEKSENRD